VQYYGQGGLSMGAGAGIAVGVLASVGLLLAFAAVWRRRTSRSATPRSMCCCATLSLVLFRAWTVLSCCSWASIQ
jgi:hypothetical protein